MGVRSHDIRVYVRSYYVYFVYISRITNVNECGHIHKFNVYIVGAKSREIRELWSADWRFWVCLKSGRG